MWMLKIVSVAIKLDNGIIHSLPKPCRHHHVIHAMNPPDNIVENDIIIARGEQGFLTNEGTFVDRKEGASIALRNGQVLKLHAPPNLYSEDLW
jgi:hypothetical protein